MWDGTSLLMFDFPAIAIASELTLRHTGVSRSRQYELIYYPQRAKLNNTYCLKSLNNALFLLRHSYILCSKRQRLHNFMIKLEGSKLVLYLLIPF